jgi:hypothetical protein
MHTPAYEQFASYVYYGIVGIFVLVLLLLSFFHLLIPALGYGLVWDKTTGVAHVLSRDAPELGDTLVARDNAGVFVKGMLEGSARQAGYTMYRIANTQGYNAMLASNQVFGVSVLAIPVAGVFLSVLAHPFGSALLLWGPLVMVLVYTVLRRYTPMQYRNPAEGYGDTQEKRREKQTVHNATRHIHPVPVAQLETSHTPRAGMFLKHE